jgi:3-oxoacyl-(acyl-carrier-protein) synthase
MAAAPGSRRKIRLQYHRRSIFLFGSVADHLAEKFGTKGSPISLSTACASGASAIQLGVEAIRRGEADAALCVGTDGSVNPEALIRFSLLSALVDPATIRRRRRQGRFRQEPRRFRHGGRRRRAGAGEL